MITDHSKLQGSFKDRWSDGSMVLDMYDFHIEHHQRRKHNNADALYRGPCNQDKECCVQVRSGQEEGATSSDRV